GRGTFGLVDNVGKRNRRGRFVRVERNVRVGIRIRRGRIRSLLRKRKLRDRERREQEQKRDQKPLDSKRSHKKLYSLSIAFIDLPEKTEPLQRVRVPAHPFGVPASAGSCD